MKPYSSNRFHRPVRNTLHFLLVPLALLFTALACNAPGSVEDGDTLYLPTPAPSPAPEEQIPGNAPAPVQPGSAFPLVIEAFGIKTSYGASGHTFCQTPAGLTLSVRSDGSALLSATGPLFVDTYNCVAKGEETWLVEGRTDPSSEIVAFVACNMGGFSATGEISYAGGVLSGEVACFTKDGEKAVLVTTEQ